MRERRSTCSVMMSSRRSGRSACQLLGVAADAGQRGLQVVRDAAQEVVLGLVEADQPAVLGLHARVELGVADRGGDLDREQVEEVLVRALPATRGGQVARDDAQGRPGDGEVGAHGDGLAGDELLDGDLARVHEEHLAVDHPEGRARVLGRAAGDGRGGLIGGDGLDGVQEPAQLLVAAREVVGQAVLALGEAADLVVAGELQAGRGVTRRDPLHGPRERPQRAREVRRQERGEHDARARPRSRSRPAGRGRGRRRCPAPAPASSRTTSPKPATGMTAAAMSPRVSRARKPRPEPR